MRALVGVSGTLAANKANRPLVLAVLGDGGLEDLVLGVLADGWRCKIKARIDAPSRHLQSSCEPETDERRTDAPPLMIIRTMV